MGASRFAFKNRLKGAFAALRGGDSRFVMVNGEPVSRSKGDAFLRQRAAYEAAATKRKTYQLHQDLTDRSGDAIYTTDGAKLRQVGRKLYRMAPGAKRAVKNIASRVVGTRGIVPQFQDDAIDEAFRLWSQRCGLRGQSWRKFQALAVADRMTAGNAFAHWSILDGKMVLQAFEPEQLYNIGLSSFTVRNDQQFSGGILFDQYARPLKYFVVPQSAGNGLPEDPEEIDAGRVVHFYDQDRPSALRGVSEFANGALSLHDLMDATGSELAAIRLAAKFGLHLKPGDAERGLDNSLGAEENTTNPDETGDVELEFSWGGVNEYEGDVKLVTSDHPGPQFDPFANRLMNNWAVSVGIPPHVVTGDYSKANYSSLRAAELACRPTYEDFQLDLIEMWCVPMVRAWLEWASLSGQIALSPGDIDREMTRLEWQKPGYPYVDPLKEIQADAERINLGLLTFDQACAERGLDGREQRARIAKAKELDALAGVATPTVAGAPSSVNSTPIDMEEITDAVQSAASGG